MKPRLPLFFLGLALLATACGAKGAGGPTGKDIQTYTSYSMQVIPLAKRWAPPAWSDTDLHGSPISSAQFAGAVTVVNFWASWCGPCREEQPVLDKLYASYRSKGVRFFGIDIRDTRVNALAHTNEFGVTYPSVFNPDESLAFHYRVIYIPETYVLDRDGKVAAREFGVTHEAAIGAAIDAELAR
jgi:thiol-disulfide isomerase/thioredoxin